MSSPDVFSRCITIIKSDYFDPEYKSVVKFLEEYFQKYSNLPTFDVVNAEYDVDFKFREITKDQFQYTCDSIEKFAKDEAILQAIKNSLDDLEKGDTGPIYDRITKALTVSLEKDLGVEFYEDPEEYLKKLLDTKIYYSTRIKALDELLGGGVARKQFSLFSANSGVGKSNILANIGANFSMEGLNVVYISLELPEDMIYLRLSTIVSGVKHILWKQKIPEISGKILSKKNQGAGSYIVKRLPNGSTVNDFKSYLKFYELEYKRVPDVIIVDYLDLMSPIGGIKNKGIFEQDKEKSEQVAEMGYIYDAIVLSASQQNREALRLASVDQGVIAGGISKVNTVDNYFSLSMDDNGRLRGEMMIHCLKSRSSKGTGKSAMLSFDEDTLIITDASKNGTSVMIDRTKIKDNKSNDLTKKLNTITSAVQGMPSERPIINDLTEKEKFIENINEEIIERNKDLPKNSLLELMKSFGTLE